MFILKPVTSKGVISRRCTFNLPLGLVPCRCPPHSAIPASGHRDLRAEINPGHEVAAAPGSGTDPALLPSVLLPSESPPGEQREMAGGAV